MRRPSIVFKIDKDLDLKVALTFRNIKAGGIDFRKCGLLLPHPDLKAHKSLSPSVLNTYINRFYGHHNKDLNVARKKIAHEWKCISKQFFSLIGEIFGPRPFLQGKYTCYLSIWNCNPRDIKDRSFQVFYRINDPIETIAHEMLHFAFYNYVCKRFVRLRRKANSKELWELSEAFNTVVLNSLRWRKQLRIKGEPPYPELRRLAQVMRKCWVRNPSIDHLFETFIIKGGAILYSPDSRKLSRRPRC